MTLTIDKPEISADGLSGTHYAAEQLIELKCRSVVFPDGRQCGPHQVRGFSFLLYRELGSGDIEAWDENNKAWVPEVDTPDPEPLAYIDNIWQNVLIAMGQEDRTGQEKFLTDPLSGFPRYFVRCSFSGIDNQDLLHEGTSPASDSFSVTGAGTRNRAGLATMPLDITQAREIRLYLKDSAAAAERGIVAIRQMGSSYEIDLNVGSSQLRLTSDGNIHLDGDVAITGSLRVNGIELHVP